MGLSDVRKRLPVVDPLPAPDDRRIKATKPGELPTPRYAVWELTLACDQKCIHCGSRAGHARPRELTTDECLDGKSISDATWAEVVKHVTDPGQQVEFIIAIGNWMMFSLLFRNLRIPLAEGVTVWPPDGLAPPAAQG